MEKEHLNESILSKEILEDQKKNRIDHMRYLPGMEILESDVMDQVITAMNGYDYHRYTKADVRRAITRENRTPEDFAALLSPAALPLLEEIAQASSRSSSTWPLISATASTCLHRFISQTTVKTIASTVVSTATIRLNVHN